MNINFEKYGWWAVLVGAAAPLFWILPSRAFQDGLQSGAVSPAMPIVPAIGGAAAAVLLILCAKIQNRVIRWMLIFCGALVTAIVLLAIVLFTSSGSDSVPPPSRNIAPDSDRGIDLRRPVFRSPRE